MAARWIAARSSAEPAVSGVARIVPLRRHPINRSLALLVHIPRSWPNHRQIRTQNSSARSITETELASELGALEQIVEPADAVPAIAIRLEHDAVPSFLGFAVIGGQQIDQQIRVVSLQPDRKFDLARLAGKIV